VAAVSLVDMARSKRRAGFAFADALDLGGVEGIQLPATLALLLRADLIGAAQTPLRHRDGDRSHEGRRFTLAAATSKGREGDAANSILNAIGYNLRLVLAWLRIILRLIFAAPFRHFAMPPAVKSAC
jgi:hypothetical protein